MHSKYLKVIDGETAGAWIRSKLRGNIGSVTNVVPSGFAAYARIFHPALDSEGSRVGWAEVAEALGKTAHRLMQWHVLVGSSDTFGIAGSNWPGDNPSLGEMDIETLDALCGRLGIHTADTGRCFSASAPSRAGMNPLLPTS
jgi:hypothetical protein